MISREEEEANWNAIFKRDKQNAEKMRYAKSERKDANGRRK